MIVQQHFASLYKFVNMKCGLIVLGLLLISLPSVSQEVSSDEAKGDKNKWTWYFAAGYNLDWFTKSDIHFEDHTDVKYDFTLYDLKADDRPGLKKMLHEDITIPQYSFRFGCYFNDKHNLGIEINYDHAKFVVRDNQATHIEGTIGEQYYDKDTVITPYWLTFEHSNGANFGMINLIKRFTIWHTPDYRHALHALVKPGIGIVLPRSDVSIFGVRRNDTYHVAGYVAGLDCGVRFNFFRYFFLDTSIKGVFANYAKVLLPGDGRANHHFFALEYIFTGGFQFGK